MGGGKCSILISKNDDVRIILADHVSPVRLVTAAIQAAADKSATDNATAMATRAAIDQGAADALATRGEILPGVACTR